MRVNLYTVSAVVRESLIEDKFFAVSDKQAYYFFCKKYGFRNRDFKVLGMQCAAY